MADRTNRVRKKRTEREPRSWSGHKSGHSASVAILVPFAQELKDEAERLHRRFIYATRPKRPLSLDEAIELHKLVEVKR